MLYMFLTKRVRQVISPTHPHITKLKRRHEPKPDEGFNHGSGFWLCVAPRLKSKALRHVYGETPREAYLNYMALYGNLCIGWLYHRPKETTRARK